MHTWEYDQSKYSPNMRILQVEDAPKITDVFSKILTMKKHAYSYEHDPELGIKKIQNENFDLIFLDLTMPKLSGFDILEDLKQKNFDTSKIIVITASTLSDKELDQLKGYNIHEIIFKPISLQKLLSTVENFSTKTILN
ncbi:response regulator transcription factor [Candidatus Nitrosarchaeum limnium]|nr:response regulator [Candidatus Nitrosarchaeum limnium]